MADGAFIGLTLAELEDIRKQQERINSTMGSPTREAALHESMGRLDPEQAATGTANDRQVGGNHYRKGELQHWDVVDRFGVPYLEGVGSKYPLRWREKGGVEDLRKTLHYIDKILESPADHPRWQRRFSLHTDLISAASALCEAHAVGPVEGRVVRTLLQGFHRVNLRPVRDELENYIRTLEQAPLPGTPEDGGHHARQAESGEEVRPLGCTVSLDVTERHLHLHLPEGCGGTLSQNGDQMHLTWGRSGS